MYMDMYMCMCMDMCTVCCVVHATGHGQQGSSHVSQSALGLKCGVHGRRVPLCQDGAEAGVRLQSLYLSLSLKPCLPLAASAMAASPSSPSLFSRTSSFVKEELTRKASARALMPDSQSSGFILTPIGPFLPIFETFDETSMLFPW